MTIRNCNVNSDIYYTNPSCSDGGCAAFVGFPIGCVATVTIEDCAFGGKIYTANSTKVTGGINYYIAQSQSSQKLTVIENDQVVEQLLTLTQNVNWFKILVAHPTEVTSVGYQFEKAEGAVTAEVMFEIRGKNAKGTGWNFIVFRNEQDISNNTAGTMVDIEELSYFNEVTMKHGNLSDSYIEDNIYHIFNSNYDEDWLSLPVLYVVQYNDSGDVVGTGYLSLSLTLPQNK